MSSSILEPNFAAIPSSLRAQPNWLCWCAVHENGKIKKPPVQAAGQNQGRLADPTNQNHWTTFERACRFYEMNRGEPLQGGTLAGIGFALTTQAGIVAVDLDDCLVDGIIQPWAAEIVRAVGCYVELSPSGRGLHIFMRGKLPWPGKRTKQIEIYSHARYLTVTGRWVRTEGIFDAAA